MTTYEQTKKIRTLLPNQFTNCKKKVLNYQEEKNSTDEQTK